MEIQRHFRDGKLIVDDGIVTGTSPGLFSFLNINSGYLFVGGVPDMMLPLSLLPIEQQVRDNINSTVMLMYYNCRLQSQY